MEELIVIRGCGSLSAAKYSSGSADNSLYTTETNFSGFNSSPVARICAEAEHQLDNILSENRSYRSLDRTVIMAIYASRKAVAEAGWQGEKHIGINIGSSRGATTLLEQYISEFELKGAVPSHASPVTTLGNISSWVGQDLQTHGAEISHSVTCSTGLQAIGNAVAWLKSGMADRFLAGASEAPITPFTLAQMRAVGIYSQDLTTAYPCRPLQFPARNSFVLGEGAAVFALERLSRKELDLTIEKPITIQSVGFGFEQLQSKTGISKDGLAFQRAMLQAMQQSADASPIDMLVMHAPGTATGDAAELFAVQSVFSSKKMPVLFSTKCLTGHTLGASGCLSIDYALQVLNTQQYLDFPYPSSVTNLPDQSIKRVMVLASGFGGNAVAVILKKYD